MQPTVPGFARGSGEITERAGDRPGSLRCRARRSVAADGSAKGRLGRVGGGRSGAASGGDLAPTRGSSGAADRGKAAGPDAESNGETGSYRAEGPATGPNS